MKLRIIIYNTLIVFFLLVAVIFPATFLGEYARQFFGTIWPLGLVVILALAGINVFFLLNYRLFTLLEKEDWAALAGYLEMKVIEKGRYSSRNIRLLAQSWLVQGKFDQISLLEEKISVVKPVLLDNHALIFGVAHILRAGSNNSGGNFISAAAFFKARLEKNPRQDWLSWYYGFSLVLAQSFDEAWTIFEKLGAESPDIIITGLSAFFLAEMLGQHARAEKGRGRALQAIKTPAAWEKKVAKLKTEVHGVIIRKYLDDAGPWIFSHKP